MGKKRNKLIVALVTLIVFMGVYMLFMDSDNIVKTSSDNVHEKSDHMALSGVHDELKIILEGDLLESMPNETKDSIVRSIKMDFEILREKDFYSVEMNQCIKVLEQNNDELTDKKLTQIYDIVHAVYNKEIDHINDVKQENRR